METSETNSLRSSSSSPEAEKPLTDRQLPHPFSSPALTISVDGNSPEPSFIEMKLDDDDRPISEMDIVFPEVGFGTEVTQKDEDEGELLISEVKLSNGQLKQ